MQSRSVGYYPPFAVTFDHVVYHGVGELIHEQLVYVLEDTLQHVHNRLLMLYFLFNVIHRLLLQKCARHCADGRRVSRQSALTKSFVDVKIKRKNLRFNANALRAVLKRKI
jgi:hypothetical protein